MEKHTPHCRLTVVKSLVAAGKTRATGSALAGAAALGIGFTGMLDIVAALKPGDFHKSMTSHGDHRTWQDVYLPDTPAGRLYVKLTVTDEAVIISFKEFLP